MNQRLRTNRWAIVAAVLFAAMVAGAIGYQFGVSHGLALNGQIPAGPPPGFGPYGWHRPWGFGFLFPFLFFGFWFLLFRGLWWGGPWRHRWHYAGPYDERTLEEWHRRAHQQGQTPEQPDSRP